MPTNLKSLLSRSRSRNELKTREKGEEISGESATNGQPNVCGTNNTDIGVGNCGTNNGVTASGCMKNGQFFHHKDESGFRSSSSNRSVSNEPTASNLKSGTSCSSHLFSSCSALNHCSPGTESSSDYARTTACVSPYATTTPSSSIVQESLDSSSPPKSLAMRKCETVLALSSFTGNQQQTTTSSPSSNSGGTFSSIASSTNGASEKVKVMKNKIFSTSSSTLNCFLHSSNRSKLFSSWKLSTSSSHNSSNHSSDYPELFDVSSGAGAAVASRSSNDNTPTTADARQVYKSQLSIPSETNLGTAPLTPLNRLRRNISINNTYFSLSPTSSYSRSSSVASFGWREKEDFPNDILCRLCLCNVKMEDTVEILACSCRYCRDCVTAYVNFEIQEGAEDIACPDATCEKQGILSIPELEGLVPLSMIEKHKKFRLYREVEKDGHLMWCPSPGCETVCRIQEIITAPPSHKSRGNEINKSLMINCATCRKSFCAECKLSWHLGSSCESFRRKLIKQGKLSLDDEELFALEGIKKCPFCHVPIEKDSGCAQMMCKRCKHVFCWYCLASLDDDFLLRHFDKGPCKNKLGHSRASVVWHRCQVIGIFAGFGVLVLLASPLLILAAPCLLCCRCRYCANKDPATEESPVPV